MKYTADKNLPDYAGISDVSINDTFFAEFLEKIRSVTASDVLTKFISDGAVENYERVARKEQGRHSGPPWYQFHTRQLR